VANRLVPIAKLGSSAAPTIHRADFARDQAFAAICGRAVDTDHESSALVLQGSASAIVRWHPARIPRIGFTRQRSQVRGLLRPPRETPATAGVSSFSAFRLDSAEAAPSRGFRA
jgi:hypothetical protein